MAIETRVEAHTIQQSFDEIQLADPKERAKAMQDSYDKIPDIRVALKLKILAQNQLVVHEAKSKARIDTPRT